MAFELKKYDEIPMAGVVPGGATPELNKTGDWRSERPVWDEETCIQCLQCWQNCPDAAFELENEEIAGIDFEFCKGCGICAQVCPVDAISMTPEGDGDTDE